MDRLPDCFVPNAECVNVLEHVRDGYDVRHEDAVPLIKAGLIKVFIGPTPRSGYELTALGEEALTRV